MVDVEHSGNVVVSYTAAARKRKASPHPELDDKVEVSGATSKHTFLNLTDIDIDSALESLRKNKNVKYVEPDLIYHGTATIPDEELFTNYQWAFNNTGQRDGTAGCDISMPEAWDLHTGSRSVKVAVIDSGVNYNLTEIAANCEQGFNFITGQPGGLDDNGHGTHIAGIIGAIGNDGLGVAGVNWQTTIVPLKFLDYNLSGTLTNLLYAVDYVSMNNIPIVNLSFASDTESTALNNAISACTNSLFLCGAGNSGRDIDSVPAWPAALTADNVITVANTDGNDALNELSNYGATKVHLAAPGTDIYSLDLVAGNYANMTGTSMSTPMVAGVAALMKAYKPTATVAEIRAALLGGVDVVAGLSGKCTTGGRLNAFAALSGLTGGTPDPVEEPDPVTPSDNPNGGVKIYRQNRFVRGVSIRNMLIGHNSIVYNETSKKITIGESNNRFNNITPVKLS